MANYLLAYHGGSMPEGDAAIAQVMGAWMTWYGQLGEAVVDGGNPVGQAATLTTAGVSAGGGANPVTGYSIIKADSLDAAIALAKACPVLMGGGSIEVCETFNVM